MHRRAVSTVTVLSVILLVVLAFPVLALADSVRNDQWHLDALSVQKAHKLSQGEGVTIGLIDTGVDADHLDLAGNIRAGKDFGTKKKGLNVEVGHGTWTASLIVGHGHGAKNAEGVLGIAPKATIVSVGLTTGTMDNDIGKAIKWLVNQEVDIISVSMGGETDYDAVDYANKKGIPLVASTGNRAQEDAILGKVVNDFMSWPANDPGAIPVSATARDGKFWDGSVDLKDASPQPRYGVSAPGEDIMGAANDGDYGVHDGTSASAPLVAGALALVKSAYPDLNYDQWIDRLLDTVDDKGPKEFDNKYGWGIVNPYRALTEETTYEGKNGSLVSSPDDRLPLGKQGKKVGDTNKDGKESDGTNDALTPAEGSPLLLSLGIIAGVVVLAAAVVVAAALAKRRTKARSGRPMPPRVG